VENTVSPHITTAGDHVECITNEFVQRYRPPRGVCQKPSPLDTVHHMETILRPNPLSPKLLSELNSSNRFTIKLGRALGIPDVAHPIARLHLCRIESIDG